MQAAVITFSDIMNLNYFISPIRAHAARTTARAMFCLLVGLPFMNNGRLNAQLTITPTNPAVTTSGSIVLTSSTPVTWSLNGVGALSNQTTTSVTYAAPSSVVPQQQLYGCPVLPNDTVFNTRIDSLPVDANSTAMIAAQSSLALTLQPSWGTSYADASTPTRTMISFYDGVTRPNFAFPLQGPNLRRESGDYVGIFQFASAPDHHVMTVRRTDCTFYESYDDYLNGYVRTCNNGTTQNCNVQSAVSYSQATYNFVPGDWGTDAAGLLLAPLVWHVNEIKGGSINHAVRFTEGLAGILFNAIRWPASSTAGGCPVAVCPNAMPMGARLRLKASVNISSFSLTAQVMLTALQRYGMILSDTGSNNAITTSSDVSEDPTVFAAVREVNSAKLPISDFEVVDESSLQVAANSYQVCPYNSTCMGAKNTYEQPQNQAVITATPTSGTAVSVPVALEGVSIGLGVPLTLPVQAGTYSFQIPYWVNNNTNQSVTWTLQSGVGSVTSTGVYTPPASTTDSGTTASTVLVGTAAADPNVTINLFLNVLPAGANPTGSIRIDSGALTNNTDGNGNVWLADIGADGTDVLTGADYPNWPTTNPERIVYQSAAQAYGGDQHYEMVVPNGNYKVHLLFGNPYYGCAAPCGYTSGYTFSPELIETQGTIQAHYFNFQSAAGYQYATPVDLYVPAQVTNNILDISGDLIVPDIGPDYASGNKYNFINGVEILPDSTAPHWAIDTQMQSTIAAGQTLLPFYVTDWYTGKNDPTWSIISGPKDAMLSGSTLSLPVGSTDLNGQGIVVQATDGTYTATATIYTTGGTRSALGILAPPNHFGYCRALTINHAQVDAAQTNFPVTISVTDPTLATTANGGHVLQSSGYDIVLTSDAAGKNLLNWEVETYNPVTGNWIGHVKIPALSNTADTVIYMFYGNLAITTNQSSPSLVWDSNFTGVYHFASLTSSTTPDSSAKNDSAVSNTGVTSGTGLFGLGASLTNTGAHLMLPVAVLNPTSGSISAWVNPTKQMISGVTYAGGTQSDGAAEFHFVEWSSYDNAVEFGWNNGKSNSTLDEPVSKVNLPTNTWSHVVYTWNQSAPSQSVYVNGMQVANLTSAFNVYTPVSNFWLGSDAQNGSYNFMGSMDEVRFSNIARSASWIATEYANQSSPATFVMCGSETKN